LTKSIKAASAGIRSEVVLQELPAPSRVAPCALAMGAQLDRGDEELAAGRLVLLYDPEVQPAWEGNARFVCYGRAAVEAEIANDPLLAEVCWSWLAEALETEHAPLHALGGTVTVTSSQRFGALNPDEEGGKQEVEMRCSWSPDGMDGGAHLIAFAEMLCTMAGLPPRGSDVASLPGHRIR
jgi:hypothetical protein